MSQYIHEDKIKELEEKANEARELLIENGRTKIWSVKLFILVLVINSLLSLFGWSFFDGVLVFFIRYFLNYGTYLPNLSWLQIVPQILFFICLIYYFIFRKYLTHKQKYLFMLMLLVELILLIPLWQWDYVSIICLVSSCNFGF